MADESMALNTSMFVAGVTNPQEIALQSLCKQLLRSQQFRGYYLERRYVESIKGYRDVVCLPKTEKVLNKMLREIRDKLQLFYSHQNPQMWIGITSGKLTGMRMPPCDVLDTYLFVELKDQAFGQYWFTIKSIRFRDNEIILKLKAQHGAEDDNQVSNNPVISQSKECHKTTAENVPTDSNALQSEVSYDDFILLFQQWGTSIKQTVYDFMAKDVSKENVKNFLRFLCLLIFSVVSGIFVGVKFLGVFTLRFMFEFSRMTQTLTPIILKMFEVFSKIVGGFYILLAMIWKDAFGNRNQPTPNTLGYNRPVYRSIQYNTSQSNGQQYGSARTGYPKYERLDRSYKF